MAFTAGHGLERHCSFKRMNKSLHSVGFTVDTQLKSFQFISESAHFFFIHLEVKFIWGVHAKKILALLIKKTALFVLCLISSLPVNLIYPLLLLLLLPL